MPSIYYNLYCDESSIHNKHTFYLGGIHCSPDRAKKLEANLALFREKTGCYNEMKWERVSKSYLSKYVDFVNIFLDDLNATFVLAEIHKDEQWQMLATTNQKRFLQTYFRFLEVAMIGYARYKIYLDDEETTPRYKWKSMHYAMNIPSLRRQKKVIEVVPVNSKQNNLAQLADVLLGALTSTEASASHKLALQDHVTTNINRKTQYGKEKLRRLDWSHIVKRHFGPKL